jgi:LysM repeat protein
MEAPQYYTQEEDPERPWMGMALLLSIPLLALLLMRLLWSGSDLWFLLAGIGFLAVSAALFLARRNDESGPTTLADEPNRLPLVLMGIGMVFVALLLVPNFSGGDSKNAPLGQTQFNNQLPTQPALVAAPTISRTQPTRAPTAQPTSRPAAEPAVGEEVIAEEPLDETDVDDEVVAPPEGSETYIVSDGDTLSDIADTFGVTIDAIISVNALDSPDDLQVGDELAIPPPSEVSADESE